MSKWEKLFSLPLRDRSTLVFYIILLPLIHLGLGQLGYARLHRFLASYPHNRPAYTGNNDEAVKEAKHCAYLVSVAARYGIIRATCLRQALLVFWLMRRRGIFTDLRIGVRKVERSIIAHAWLKYGEDVITEGSLVEKNFSAFEDLPGVK